MCIGSVLSVHEVEQHSQFMFPSVPGMLVSTAVRTIRKRLMAWTTPILVEICIGLEINGYLPAEF